LGDAVLDEELNLIQSILPDLIRETLIEVELEKE